LVQGHVSAVHGVISMEQITKFLAESKLDLRKFCHLHCELCDMSWTLCWSN